MEEIKKQWSIFQSMPYPKDFVRDETETEDLLSLDTYAAGCISFFINNQGTLDIARKKILKNCLLGLEIALLHLTKQEKEYFQVLYNLVKDVNACAK